MYNLLHVHIRSSLGVTSCTTPYVWDLCFVLLYVQLFTYETFDSCYMFNLLHMRSLLHPVLSWGSVLLWGLTISVAVWAGAPCSPSCSHTGRQNSSIKNKMAIAVNCIHYFKAPLDWRYNIHGQVSYTCNSFLNFQGDNAVSNNYRISGKRNFDQIKISLLSQKQVKSVLWKDPSYYCRQTDKSP